MANTNESEKQQILNEYSKIIQEYNDIIDDQTRINNLLSKFVVNGVPISTGVYNDGTAKGPDIDLPDDTKEYQQAIRTVNSDIKAVESVATKTKDLIKKCENSNDYKDVVDSLDKLYANLNSMKEGRENVADNLKKLATYVKQKKKEKANDAGGDGGGGGKDNSYSGLAKKYGTKADKGIEGLKSELQKYTYGNGKCLGSDTYGNLNFNGDSTEMYLPTEAELLVMIKSASGIITDLSTEIA